MFITIFRNQKNRLDYHNYFFRNEPINRPIVGNTNRGVAVPINPEGQLVITYNGSPNAEINPDVNLYRFYFKLFDYFNYKSLSLLHIIYNIYWLEILCPVQNYRTRHCLRHCTNDIYMVFDLY